MEENKTLTNTRQKNTVHTVIAKTCTVSRTGKLLNFIMVEVQSGEWILYFTYRDASAEFSASVQKGDMDTLPPRQYRAMRRKAIQEMKRAEPSLGIKIAQWINE